MKRSLLPPILALLLFLAIVPATEAAPNSHRRVILVLVPAVSAADFDLVGMPNFRWLIEHGSVGLMNTRTASLPWPADARDLSVDPVRGNAYLTLGAGTRCAVGPLGAEGFQSREWTWEGEAVAVYARRNLGRGGDGALQINPLSIRETNTGLGYRAQPGALGELLKAAGIETAVIGEADRPGELHREGVLTAMDTQGQVRFAAFQTSAMRPHAAFGRSMSLERVDRAMTDSLERSRFLVIDWGDTARLDDERSVMLPRAADAAQKRAMRHLDDLFGLLRKRLDFTRDRLLIVAPYPSRRARAAYDLLCPVISIDGGGPGLLASPTTRRAGVIANVDIAPMVARSFDIIALPSSFVGRAAASQSDPSAWNRLLALRSRLLEVERERRNVLRDLVSLLTMGMLGFALLFVVSNGGGIRWVPLTAAFLPPALPLALLILAFYPFPSVGTFTLALSLLTAGLASLASALTLPRRRATDGIAFLGLATFALVAADGLRGFPHMPYCILSYSLMEGARYYGIGNEYMGAFLAATALGGTALFTGAERKLPVIPRARVAALFLAGTLLLAGPAFGAKFGGGVAAAGGFGVCLLLLFLRRLKLRHLVVVFLGIVAVVALMVLLDSLRGGHSSHIGRAFAAVRGEGIGELGLIIQRKASMNLRLLMFSPWSRLMGAALLATLAGFLLRKRRYGSALPTGPMGAGVAGAMAAALVAFLVDDAGVLAAATALIFVPSTLFAAYRDELFAETQGVGT